MFNAILLQLTVTAKHYNIGLISIYPNIFHLLIIEKISY